jgi:amino acid transporter
MMGVSVRVSRNARVYLPFWLAIPVYTVVGATWAAIGLIIALWWLLAILPARGIKALAERI